MKIFGQHVPRPILLLALAEFGFTGIVFMLSAWLLISAGLILGDQDIPILTWALAFSTAVLIGVTAMGLYQVKQRLRIEGIVARLTLGLGLAAIGLSVVDFFYPLGIGGPVWIVSFFVSLLLLCLSRVMFLKLVDQGAFQRRVLVYGAGKRAGSLLTLRRRSDQRGFRIAGFVASPGDEATVEADRLVDPQGSLLEFALENQVNEIVVAMDDRRGGFPIKDLLECKFAGIAVLDLLAFLERETGKLKVDLLNPAWLIFSEGFTIKPSRELASRTVDLLVSSVLFLCSMPIMLVVALAILIEDGRPILFRQRRVGLRGAEFTLFKFRSMVKHAEADGRARWAGAGDVRITHVGRVIRKLRLDELPQLINVVRGDMSLVGPRPERPEFVQTLSRKIPYYHERHSVKPGITGWAQLCYPYGSSEHDAMEKLQYDLYYVKHKSLIFDLVVMLQTVEVVLWGKGAR